MYVPAFRMAVFHIVAVKVYCSQSQCRANITSYVENTCTGLRSRSKEHSAEQTQKMIACKVIGIFVDATCNKVREEEGSDRYLNCVTNVLEQGYKFRKNNLDNAVSCRI